MLQLSLFFVSMCSPQDVQIDPDLLSIRHIAEPEYSAFAVVHICAQTINVDLQELVK